MSKFTRGDAIVTPDGTLATFIKEVDDMTSVAKNSPAASMKKT